MKRFIALPIAATVLAALLGACTGDESGSSSSSESESSSDSDSDSGSDSGSDSDSGSESSSGSDGDYCALLEDSRSSLEDLGPTGGDLEQIRDTFNELEREAPEEVKSDWARLSGAFDTLDKALNDAGVKLEDLQGLQSGQLPEGVNPQDLAGVAEEVQKLNTPEFEKSARDITTHAQEECGVDLGGSQSPSAPESGSGGN